MSSSQIFTSSEFSFVFCMSCSLIEAREISSFFRQAFNLVTSAWCVRLTSASVLLALEMEKFGNSKLLTVEVHLHFKLGHRVGLHFIVAGFLHLQIVGEGLSVLQNHLLAFLEFDCDLLRSFIFSKIKIFILIFTEKLWSLSTHAWRSENVVSNDVRWFAFSSLSFLRSAHFFSHDCTSWSFSAISSEIAFSYASTTPLKQKFQLINLI